MPRRDDPMSVTTHTGKYLNGTALIVLGGPSNSNWESLREKISPDVILGANGVNSMILSLDYWMCIENMRRSWSMARKGDRRSREFVSMLRQTGAKYRITNWKNVPILTNRVDVLSVQRREAFEFDKVPADFLFRDYGKGFIKGALMKDTKAIGNLKLPVGTVALQLLHMAGILGCASVHTIGLDLCFRGEKHHGYKYPAYEPNRYFLKDNFIEYEGVKTMQFWVETAQYLIGIEPAMRNEGLVWTDHSNGLLDMMR